MLFEALVANTHIPVATRLIVGAVPGVIVAGLLAVLRRSLHGSSTGILAGSARNRFHQPPAIPQLTIPHRPTLRDNLGGSAPPPGTRSQSARNRLSRSPLAGLQSP